MKAQIRLDTIEDVRNFVSITTKIPSVITITDGAGLKVNAKSLMGVLYALEFNELWCESDTDIYSKINHFVIE